MLSFYKQQTYFSQIVSKKSQDNNIILMKNLQNNNIYLVFCLFRGKNICWKWELVLYYLKENESLTTFC